jgi:muramoyltetrapeptide carboxypeptidase
MSILVPSKLKPGDTIGVVTPSAPISMSPSPDPFVELERGITMLKKLGFKVRLGEHALKEGFFTAGSSRERAEDINNMFADPKIKAIIPSHGGYNYNGCLPYLDWDVIRDNPKILMGFSGCTIFLLAMYARVGLVTFHGNMIIWHFGLNPSVYDRAEFLARLVEGRIGSINKNSVWRTIRGDTPVEGRLLGGHLGQLTRLAGTPYLPDFSKALLFLEQWGEEPAVTKMRLIHLQQMGLFEQIRGIIVGHIANDGEYHLEKMLADITTDFGFPILKCEDFGHQCPNTVLPVGVQAKLDPVQASLEILEPCVR